MTVRVTIGVVGALAGVVIAASPGQAASLAKAANPPHIPVASVQGHLRHLQEIATKNAGNRAHGTQGFKGSLDYVKGLLDAAGYVTRIQEFKTEGKTGYNLIADSKGGDLDQTVMLGAHLDSVKAGPGINDNGSGTASILSVALAAAKLDSAKHLRFAWFGAEELDLDGSQFYVHSLSAKDKKAIKAYLNFDMLGSPNGGYFVMTAKGAPTGSAPLEKIFTDYYTGISVKSELSVRDGESDYDSFEKAGIPIGGLDTGADDNKTAAQAKKWGGQAGKPYDSCYHKACDNAQNINETILDRTANAAANALWALAG